MLFAKILRKTTTSTCRRGNYSISMIYHQRVVSIFHQTYRGISLEQGSKTLSSSDIITRLVALRNQSKSNLDSLILEIAQAPSPKIDSVSGEDWLRALACLESVSSDSAGTIELLRRLADLTSSLSGPINSELVCCAFGGLVRMDADHEEVRRIVQYLAILLRQSFTHGLPSTEDCATALSGFSLMKSTHPEVRMALLSIHDALHPPRLILPTACCRALSGLARMSSDHKEVRDIVKILEGQLREPVRTGKGQKITTYASPLTDIDMVRAGKSLCGLSSDHAEVRGLIGAITGRIQSMGAWDAGIKAVRTPETQGPASRLSAAAVLSILSNLREMDSQHEVVKKLLRRVTSHLNCIQSVEALSASQFALSLSGLRNMSSQESSVKDLLSALYFNFTSSKHKRISLHDKFTRYDLCTALTGLSSMTSECGEVKKILAVLVHKLGRLSKEGSKAKGNNIESTTREAVSSLPSIPLIADAIGALSGMAGDEQEIRGLIPILTKLLEAQSAALDPTDIQVVLTHTVIAKMVSGLKNKTSDKEEVRDLLRVIAVVINKRNNNDDRSHPLVNFKPTEFVDLFSGVRYLDSSYYEVRALLRSLLPLLLPLPLSSSIDPSHTLHLNLGTHQLLSVMKGLKSFSNEACGDSSEGWRSDCHPPPPILVGDPLRGGRRGRGAPICDLLSLVSSVISSCSAPLSRSGVCEALHSLQCLQSGPRDTISYCPDLVNVISQLLDMFILSGGSHSVGIKDATMALHGLIDVADGASTQISSFRSDLLQTCLNHMHRQSLQPSPDPSLAGLIRILNMYTVRPDYMSSPANTALLNQARQACPPILPPTHSDARGSSTHPPPSRLEHRFITTLTKAIKGQLVGSKALSDASVRLHALPFIFKLKTSVHMECFESDIVILVLRRDGNDGDSPVHAFNIEIDGPTHAIPYRRNFSRWRDDYLVTHGVDEGFLHHANKRSTTMEQPPHMKCNIIDDEKGDSDSVGVVRTGGCNKGRRIPVTVLRIVFSDNSVIADNAERDIQLADKLSFMHDFLQKKSEYYTMENQ